jgi:hypothetical protein
VWKVFENVLKPADAGFDREIVIPVKSTFFIKKHIMFWIKNQVSKEFFEGKHRNRGCMAPVFMQSANGKIKQKRARKKTGFFWQTCHSVGLFMIEKNPLLPGYTHPDPWEN